MSTLPCFRTRRPLVILCIVASAGACDGAGAPVSPPVVPESGSIRATVATAGEDMDATGYVIVLGGDRRAVGVNATVEFADVRPGQWPVRLEEVAPNCSPDVAVQSATVAANATTELVFEVGCVVRREVVFWRWIGDRRDLFVMMTDGTGLTNLTNDAVAEISPVWSPDGSRIAYVASRDGGAEIHVMDADGSNRLRLTDGPDEDNFPSWSPDGSRIAFSRGTAGGGFDIYVMNADGSGITNLTDDPATFDIEPAWSPDGATIAFERDGGLYVMNADGSGETRLTADGTGPAWSPDGTRIAFSSRRSGNLDIHVMNVDGEGTVQLTGSDADDIHPAWSPDGSRIAFTSFRDGHGSIYLMKPDGGGAVLLADGAAGESHQVDWRP